MSWSGGAAFEYCDVSMVGFIWDGIAFNPSGAAHSPIGNYCTISLWKLSTLLAGPASLIAKHYCESIRIRRNGKLKGTVLH